MHFQFLYNSDIHVAEIKQFEELSPIDIKAYDVTENTFLVHLFRPQGIISFELFIPEGDLNWKSKPEVDAGLMEIIGKHIDSSSA